MRRRAYGPQVCLSYPTNSRPGVHCTDDKPGLETAYFEESIEHTTGLVPRRAFETQLRDHYAHPKPPESDFSWYTLRNIVFAIGCRYAVSRGGRPANYIAAQRQSWGYFENALSVHTNLVYMPSDISAIEAIALMVGLT